MLIINGKIFMNIEEAVEWLLQNNALPFICKADYAADTIIAKSEIVNPSPVELKVGAVVYFRDCKIAVVTGITSNGFKVGSDHIDMREGIFDGDITIGGDLDVDGDAKIFEDIVDKDGHKRFIEGDITTVDNADVDYTYAKWSLSGSHIMLVIAGKFTAGATILPYEFGGSVELPDWIRSKLVPTANQVLDFKTFPTTATGYSQANTFASYASLDGTGKVIVTSYSSITIGADDEYFRIQYDFLIDNE